MRTIQLEPNKQPRKFRFNFNALAEYEIAYGGSPDNITGLGVSNARRIAYIGFKEGDDNFELSEKEVGRLLNSENLNLIFEAFSEEMSTMNGKKEKGSHQA